MKFYYLETKFSSGKYKGQTLEEVFEKDPEYVDTCLREDDNFLLTEEVLDELQAANPDYEFSEEALARRDEKESELDKGGDDEGEFDSFDDDDDLDDFDDDVDFDEDFDEAAFDEDFEEEDLDDIYNDDLDDDFDDYDDSHEDSRWDRF